MPGKDARQFMDELRDNIRSKDLIKAKVVLSFIGEMEMKVRKQALFELSRADDDLSIPLLAAVIANSREMTESFPVLKETLYSKVLDSPEVLLQLLRDRDCGERSFLATVAGEIQLEGAAPILCQVLTSETDVRILESAILSLGMIGSPSATSVIAEFLYARDERLYSAAIWCLGQLATPTAVQRLSERLGHDPQMDVLLIEAIAACPTPDALARLNEMIGSHFAHIRTAAKKKLVEIGEKAVPLLVDNLRYDDPDLLTHTLNVMGEIGDEAVIPAIRKLLHNEPSDANVRFAAYEALGMLPMQKGAYALASGLQDPVENVRAAAAGAISRNYSSVLAAGIKNIVRAGDEDAAAIVRTIIDTQCDNVFMDLLDESFFLEQVGRYLHEGAHPDIRSHFSQLLIENGRGDMAAGVTREGESAPAARLKVYAVDDSKMILNIYRSVLHKLGFEPHLFQFPAQALDRIRTDRPDVILTDLNMPEVTGIELTRGVRHWYSKEDLPIVMVTTQNEIQDNEAAYAAGVNLILYKPFNERQIEEAIATLKLDRNWKE